MPVIFDSISSKIGDGVLQGLKKENIETNHVPTIKQVLQAVIEYEEAPNHANSTLNSLQTKYIVLKANQQATNAPLSYAKVLQTTDNTNDKNKTSSTSTSPSQLPKPKRVLFDNANIQLGWNLPIVRSWGHGSGFNNVGNTCYLNSALQAFLHVPALAQWLISDKEHRERCKENICIICNMANTLISTHRTNNMSFTPSLITNRLQHICKHLTLGRQEDAHEFLRYLVEKMEKSYLMRFRNEPWSKDLDQYSKETTPLNQLLGGYLRSTVTCLSCNHESVTFQHFQDLPLDISRHTRLNEAIDGYFSRENLEECGYKCESCKRRVSAAKKFTLERPPVVLCIQLKRFTAMGGKISKQITITEQLTLRKYLSKASDSTQKCSYKFMSMVTHLGSSAGGGHYTAVGMAPNGNYYEFDDSRVQHLPLNHALKPNAYVLFYELEQSSNIMPVPSRAPQQPQHNVVLQNGHNYSKHSSDHNGSGMSFSRASFSSDPGGFSKPKIPFVPTKLMRDNMKQQQQLKQQQKENSPSKNGPRPTGAETSQRNGGSNESRIAPSSLLKSPTNGLKRENSDQLQSQTSKKAKCEPFPSLSRIDGDDEVDTKKMNGSGSSQLAQLTPPTTPSKVTSLVPYGTDDEDEEVNGKVETKFLRTASGLFLEADLKENNKGPSVKGSTISTKASSEGNVKRSEDTVQQLTKLHHNGYGGSNVQTWSNQPSQMGNGKEATSEDRKRHHERNEEDEAEMDRGRVKKVKIHCKSPPRNHSNNGKLPNPFQEHENMKNNGHFDRNSSNYHHGNSYRPAHHHSNGNGNYKYENMKNNGHFERNSSHYHHGNSHRPAYHHANGNGNYNKYNNNKNRQGYHNGNNNRYNNRR